MILKLIMKNEEESKDEMQESLILTPKIQSRPIEMQNETSDPMLLKANIADLQRQLALEIRSDQVQ